MLATLEEFEAELSELSAFVRALRATYDGISKDENREVRESLTIRRRLDYAAFVVTLYSVFERFVESLVWSRAEIDTVRRSYEELPIGLRTKHLRESADLLIRGGLGWGRYETLTTEEVVANLHLCLSKSHPYRMTRAAVIRHDVNLREEAIVALFLAIGVPNVDKQVRNMGSLTEWLAEVEGGSVWPELPASTVDLRIKNLVDRRNQVAHGSGAGESLSSEEMTEFIDFFRAYGQAVFRVVGVGYIDQYLVHAGVDLGALVEGPFKAGRVVVVVRPKTRLFVGQPVFSKSSAGRVNQWGAIVELQVDGVSHPELEAADRESLVGIRLDFSIAKSARLFVLITKDDLLWQ